MIYLIGPASTTGVDLGPAALTRWVDRPSFDAMVNIGPSSTKWVDLGPASTKCLLLLAQFGQNG